MLYFLLKQNGVCMYDFGIVRELRKREGFTLDEIQARSGVTPAVLSRIERNMAQPELDTLYRLPRACMIVAVTELCIALMAGWMIFPFVFGYGHAPDEGSQLAFVTLPQVFTEMRGGFWVGILFFSLFFAAAFSSSLAGLKVIVAAVSEELKLPNRYAVLAVSVLMLLLGTASALSFTPLDWRIAGEPVLDFIDRVAGGNVIIVSGILGAAFFCWLVPPQRIRDVLGTPHPWWHWRIYIVGRFLPVVVIVWLIVTRFLQSVV